MSDLIERTSFALRHSVYLSSIRCFFIFYILVGLPNGFQGRFLPIYFRSHGMSLTRVGLYRLLVLPWLLKGMWTAYIDRNTDVRVWLKTSLFLLVLLCVVAAQFSPTDTVPMVIILFLFNLITSVQDTAVDSLIIDVFTPAQLLVGNVAQAVGDKIGSIISGGLFAWYIEVLTLSAVYYIMAAMYAFGLLTSYFLLPDWNTGRASIAPQVSEPHAGREGTDARLSVADTAKKFLSEASIWMFVFVLFYKIGEVGVLNLFPLFLVDQGVEASEIGLWIGIIAQSVSIVGSTATAFFTFHSILGPLTVLMVIRGLCVAVSWVAVVLWRVNPDLCYDVGVLCLVLVALTGGAITTCTQTLVMQLSQRAPRHERPRHYAVYSFGELLAKLLFSAGVGALAQITSYEFAFGFFAAAALVIVPFLWLAPGDVVIRMYHD